MIRNTSLHSNSFILYGKQPLLFAIKNKTRAFIKIYISNSSKSLFEKFCKDESINLSSLNISYVEKKEIDKIAKEDINHQGFYALAHKRQKLYINDFINYSNKQISLPSLLILDQVTDPHNVGAIIRSACAFGVNHIIVTEFNSIYDSSIIIKSSAGMSENVKIYEVTNLSNSIEELKKTGYFIYGLDGNAKGYISSIKDSRNIALILGSEGYGMRRLTKDNCDELIKIPMSKNVESLNVSVAGGIACYEIWGKNLKIK